MLSKLYATALALVLGILFIPVEAEAAHYVSDVHMVKRGHSLSQIAKEQLGDVDRWECLAKDNKVQGPRYIIHPGQKIRLENCRVTLSNLKDAIHKTASNRNASNAAAASKATVHAPEQVQARKSTDPTPFLDETEATFDEPNSSVSIESMPNKGIVPESVLPKEPLDTRPRYGLNVSDGYRPERARIRPRTTRSRRDSLATRTKPELIKLPERYVASRVLAYFRTTNLSGTMMSIGLHESAHYINNMNWNCRYDLRTGRVLGPGEESSVKRRNRVMRPCKPQHRHLAAGVDCGYFQINVPGALSCPEELMQLEGNIKAARRLYDNGGLWHWMVVRKGLHQSTNSRYQNLVARVAREKQRERVQAGASRGPIVLATNMLRSP